MKYLASSIIFCIGLLIVFIATHNIILVAGLGILFVSEWVYSIEKDT